MICKALSNPYIVCQALAPCRSALLMTKTLAISMIPALIVCISVARTRREHQHGRIRKMRDIDFVLPHADGFDEDEIGGPRHPAVRQISWCWLPVRR